MKHVSIKQELSDCPADERFRRYRELWQLAETYQITTDFPLHLDIELAGVCNLHCHACFQNGLLTQKLGIMKPELFRAIIDEGAESGLCAIKLQVRGEAFLNPHFFELVSYAHEKGVQDIQVTTNATKLDPEMAEKILDSRLSEIIFSIDEHHSLSADARNISYEGVSAKVADLLARRTQRRQQTPKIRIVSSLDSDSQGALTLRRQWLRARFPDADTIVVSRLHNFRNDQPAFEDLHSHYHLKPCHYLFTRLTVFWDGQVTACCVDYNNEFHFGSFPGQSIRDIWNSQKVASLRQQHLGGKRGQLPICANCPTNVVPRQDVPSPASLRYVVDEIATDRPWEDIVDP